jgi:hypothetical protein
VILSHHTARAFNNALLKKRGRGLISTANKNLLDTDLRPTRTAMEEPSGVWEAAPAACAAVLCVASFIGSTNGLEFERHREVSPVSGEVMLSRRGNATAE